MEISCGLRYATVCVIICVLVQNENIWYLSFIRHWPTSEGAIERALKWDK